MFKIRGNLLRAYVPQKTIQPRPIYSARGEDSGKTTPRKCQTKNNTIPFHLLRARGGASSAMMPPSRLETVTSCGNCPSVLEKSFFLLMAMWREFRVHGFEKCRSGTNSRSLLDHHDGFAIPPAIWREFRVQGFEKCLSSTNARSLLDHHDGIAIPP